MMLARAYLEPPVQRFARWTGAAGMVAALHLGAVAFAFLFWPNEEPHDDERPGAIMIELPALAAESPSDQPDLSEQPQFEKSAPPPSPADDVEETPTATEPPPEKVAEAQEVTPPTPVAEPLPEPVKETPPVEEAPLAPDPEVTLPKEAAPEVEKKKDEPEKQIEARPKEKTPAKTAQKAESRQQQQQQQQAAASAKGRFDPNPIYRAKPAYPASARAAKIEGYVVVSYSVSASGAVSNVRVVSANPPGLFNGVTVAAVQQWRFKPSPSGAQGRRTTIHFKLR